MNKFAWLLIILMVGGIGLWWLGFRLPGSDADAVNAFLSSRGMNPNAFFSYSLIGLRASEPGVSVERLEEVKRFFEEKRDRAPTEQEREKFNSFAGLASLYAAKQSIKDESRFFQEETNLTALCARLSDATRLVQAQEDVYVQSLDLFATSLELKQRFGEQWFSISPEYEYQALKQLQLELLGFKAGCGAQ